MEEKIKPGNWDTSIIIESDVHRVVNIDDLKPTENVCQQTLKEIASLKRVSMAYVAMDWRAASLPHRHQNTHEVYFILNGEGVMHVGLWGIDVRNDICVVIPKDNVHFLENYTYMGNKQLTHLVFASPPFDKNDVNVENTYRNRVPSYFTFAEGGTNSKNEKYPLTFYKYGGPERDESLSLSATHHNPELDKSSSLNTIDGTEAYELVREKEISIFGKKYPVMNDLGFSLVLGILSAGRKAAIHSHKESDEIYYVLNGVGRVCIGNSEYDVRQGSVVYVPKGNMHSLQNLSETELLRVLCVTSPQYENRDMYII
jgi:mannose-6-phosphate isomerase-like protein (cupin superfamily)